MRKVALSILLCSAFFGSCELGVRGLYGLAHSSLYRGWFLAWDLSGRLELEPHESAFLASGFLAPVRTPDGLSFAWAGALRSEVSLPLLWRRDRTLQLRLRRFPHPSAAASRIELQLDGESLGTVPPGADWKELQLPLPARLQSLGENRLVLLTPDLYPATLLPGGKNDPRLLGFQLDWIALR